MTDRNEREPDPVTINPPQEYDPDMTVAEWEALGPK